MSIDFTDTLELLDKIRRLVDREYNIRQRKLKINRLINMRIIRSNFLWLTSRTYPYGTEKKLDKQLMDEFGFKYDNHKNLYRVVLREDKVAPSTMFTAHLDTVHDSRFYQFCRKHKLPWVKSKSVNHVFAKDNDFVRSDGKTTLGTDDKAGVVIILEMIKANKPGVYYLFKGEEVGHVGAKSLKEFLFENRDLKNIQKCISLDRKGYDSIITHQKNIRCCSDEFASTIAEKLNVQGFWFRPDPFGMSTDSLDFIDRYPECTNISIGCFRMHTNKECQDLEFLEALSDAILNIDWEEIKTTRVILGKKKDVNFAFEDFSYTKLKKLLIKPII